MKNLIKFESLIRSLFKLRFLEYHGEVKNTKNAKKMV